MSLSVPLEPPSKEILHISAHYLVILVKYIIFNSIQFNAVVWWTLRPWGFISICMDANEALQGETFVTPLLSLTCSCTKRILSNRQSKSCQDSWNLLAVKLKIILTQNNSTASLKPYHDATQPAMMTQLMVSSLSKIVLVIPWLPVRSYAYSSSNLHLELSQLNCMKTLQIESLYGFVAQLASL